MKIVGFHSAHDSSYSVLEDGVPKVHNEIERFNRIKNCVANSIKFFIDNDEDVNNIDSITTHRTGGPKDNDYMDDLEMCEEVVKRNGGELYVTGHHQAHAANAFFSSNFKEALIMTIDGGGVDNEDGSLHHKDEIDTSKSAVNTCTTFWLGKDNKIEPLKMIRNKKLNIGFYWANVTKQIFGLGTWGDPRGDQAGTVMGMAALGNPEKYRGHFKNMKDGYVIPKNHQLLRRETQRDEREGFHVAAALQAETEEIMKAYLTPYIEKYKPKNLCLSGGVSLNCVSVGKMFDWFPGIKIFCDPIPYDAGLSLGSSRYVWHQILDKPRVYDNPKNWSPYLGYTYSEEQVESAILDRADEIETIGCDDDYVIELMTQKKIISVFGGGSESGRRALGNRSILADPRSEENKDIVNEKVKHRQWFRPFAPSILRDYVKDWFVHDVDSPYMSVALKFKEGMGEKVPAVLHHDYTARLQTVKKEDNEWYYNFIDKFRKKTGVPIVLNTSFNDREPIVETPEHGLDCFLRTNIDYLYFRDYGILVSKLWIK